MMNFEGSSFSLTRPAATEQQNPQHLMKHESMWATIQSFLEPGLQVSTSQARTKETSDHLRKVKGKTLALLQQLELADYSV